MNIVHRVYFFRKLCYVRKEGDRSMLEKKKEVLTYNFKKES